MSSNVDVVTDKKMRKDASIRSYIYVLMIRNLLPVLLCGRLVCVCRSIPLTEYLAVLMF